MRRVHVIGAGLSGLAAAVTAAQAGRKVVLWEAAPRAGGRCRSWADADAGAEIDNGTHLALSGNRALRRYLRLTGAAERMTTLRPAAFPFVDLATGASWTLRPGAGALLSAARRPPGVAAAALAADCWRLLRAPAQAVVAEVLDRSPAYASLWRPLAISALNAAPEIGSAQLLAAVARESLLRGESACRPMLPRRSLDDAFIAPALAALAARGAEIHLSARVTALAFAGDRAVGLRGPDARLTDDDAVIIAAPSWAAAALVPDLAPPPAGPAIVNVHFRAQLGAPPLLGLCGGRVDWLFQSDAGVLSATVSDADDLAARPAADIAALIWDEARRAANLHKAPPHNKAPPDDALPPPCRTVKERRATVSAAPSAQSARPGPVTRWKNLFLAGDWTATGLPSTMEGAARAGFNAAAACLNG